MGDRIISCTIMRYMYYSEVDDLKLLGTEVHIAIYNPYLYTQEHLYG